jgi:sterol desaturase/sphingolipid hydroxylase (fatty acid hydroxylase superfamily)
MIKDILYPILICLVSLLFLALVFIPMEKVFPAKENQKVFRKSWLLDLCYFLGQYLIWNGLVLLALNYFDSWISAWFPHGFRDILKKQPIWLQAIEVIVLSDILIYWGHRIQHKVDFLWRFHKIHHSAEKLDWLAAHREHPLDSIYTVGLINLPAILMGFDLQAISWLVAFRGIWAIYIHSNVRLSLGPLKMLIGSPELHHWHHDIERDAGNYANISPLMDLLFGTYVCPPAEPENFGIKEEFPQNYIGQMLKPLVPDNLWNNIAGKTSDLTEAASSLDENTITKSV